MGSMERCSILGFFMGLYYYSPAIRGYVTMVLCDEVGPAGCVVGASERISVLVTIKTNQSVAKHAADDGQHVCRLYTHFTASTGALLTGPTEVLPF